MADQDPEAAYEEMQARIRHIVEMVEQLPPIERAAFEMLVHQEVLDVEQNGPNQASVETIERSYKALLAYLRSVDTPNE